MNAQELAAGKGKRVEIQSDDITKTGTLMGQQRNKYTVSFYVRLDGETERSLIPARRINRFV